jgi:hypothetical protein
MDDQLFQNYERWCDAEHEDRTTDAEAAFGEVFQTVASRPAVSAGFTARTMEAVVSAAARDARRARRVRTLGVPAAMVGCAAALYFSAGMLIAGLSAAVVWLLNLAVGAVVTIATAVQSGPDGWSVMSSLGRATAAVIANPAVTITIFAIQGFAIAALMVLRRLLDSDRESYR